MKEENICLTVLIFLPGVKNDPLAPDFRLEGVPFKSFLLILVGLGTHINNIVDFFKISLLLTKVDFLFHDVLSLID